MFATVAICTRDRAHLLSATLDSLLRQTYRNKEILVVDNAPGDDSAERLVRGRYPSVRYVREERPGLDVGDLRVALHGDAMKCLLAPLKRRPAVKCAHSLLVEHGALS